MLAALSDSPERLTEQQWKVGSKILTPGMFATDAAEISSTKRSLLIRRRLPGASVAKNLSKEPGLS
jgi:hypothetical protein